MNCGSYQNLISAFLDGELDAETWAAVEDHMTSCEDCSSVYSDFSAILEFCGESLADEKGPSNSHALWCRINNVIESEVADPQGSQAEEFDLPPRRGFWHDTMNMSAGQIASVIMGVALVSSLLTVVAFKNYISASEAVTGADIQPTVFEKVLAQLGMAEDAGSRNERRIREQKEAIEYWKSRVEVRRASWNDETRLVFDRNLGEIDKAVTEYSRLLQENPQDTISNEMLDSALKEKMELLREFSEL